MTDALDKIIEDLEVDDSIEIIKRDSCLELIYRRYSPVIDKLWTCRKPVHYSGLNLEPRDVVYTVFRAMMRDVDLEEISAMELYEGKTEVEIGEVRVAKTVRHSEKSIADMSKKEFFDWLFPKPEEDNVSNKG